MRSEHLWTAVYVLYVVCECYMGTCHLLLTSKTYSIFHQANGYEKHMEHI